MKLKLTESAELELKVINKRIEEDEEAYDSLNEHELLVVDAELYVEDGYVENEFDDLDEWCHEVGLGEYDPKYLAKHPNVVKDKVNEMITKGIITLINS
jgi:hypothetical protein